MDAYAEIAAYHQHAYVETQSGTCAKGYVAEKRLGLEPSAGTLRIILEQPHIAGVEEHRSVKRPEYRETVLDIGFKFESTGLVEVIVGAVAVVVIGAPGRCCAP